MQSITNPYIHPWAGLQTTLSAPSLFDSHTKYTHTHARVRAHLLVPDLGVVIRSVTKRVMQQQQTLCKGVIPALSLPPAPSYSLALTSKGWEWGLSKNSQKTPMNGSCLISKPPTCSHHLVLSYVVVAHINTLANWLNHSVKTTGKKRRMPVRRHNRHGMIKSLWVFIRVTPILGSFVILWKSAITGKVFFFFFFAPTCKYTQQTKEQSMIMNNKGEKNSRAKNYLLKI